MNQAAIYHRPESEFAYLYKKNLMHIRLQTGKDVAEVCLLHGDPYELETKRWFKKSISLDKWLSTESHDFWQIEVTAPYKRLSYGFLVKGIDGSEILYNDQGIFSVEEKYLLEGNMYFRMPYFQEIDRFKAPDWVKETVWYQIFPERFANGDLQNDPVGTLKWGSKEHPDRTDFYGGDLQGVTDHLDYLVDLGINGIYFCPIFTAHSNHKYDTIDYFQIDPAFGDTETFKELVAACHQRGIRVMLDAVFNHLGDQSPQWQDVVKNGEHSRYKDWFMIDSFPVSYTETNDFEFASEKNYDTFAFTPHMSKLNTANPEVQDFILEVASYWIKEFEIDAWRLDVANEVDHHLWKKFHEVCFNLNPDFYLLGEIWHSAQSWLQGDEFTGVMNYAFTDAIIGYFLDKKISLTQMVSKLNRQLTMYRKQTSQMMMNVLDSHDTPRILTVANGDKALMRQAEAFTYLQTGSPCLYYGDEIAMTGEMDPDCRKCMVWEKEKQDFAMLAFFKELIIFRKKYATLLSEGSIVWEKIDKVSGELILVREFAGVELQAVFNTGENELTHQFSGEVLLQQLTKKSKDCLSIAAKGFVIYQKES
ncbi:glycoside hydrolase family 13 protein [Enterococcus alishanensis]|uniref:Glycoside hydrolase family 13 protein n=1 Tax=Enterococcus alishanensis TaxID=1303817 RepID=A0ABS6TFN8_9ENTE|nr:glycoside hydrolase family 13 protein [Enterococcus alishanensis]MBV7391672.1 glycoside hydrolase family 13 protein [Enterococcus alishanensis]